MYQAKSGFKNFSLSGKGGGPSTKNFFSPVWTCIKPNLVSKNFPFTGGGVPRQKFVCQSEHVSSQIWCQKFFPLLGGGPLTKIFFLVWTCIKPNLVSKNFPFTETGYPPSPKIWDWVLPQKSETWDPPKIWDLGFPPQIWDLGPPQKSETWDSPLPGPGPGNPSPPKVNRQTFPSINITFPRTTYAGGNNNVTFLDLEHRTVQTGESVVDLSLTTSSVLSRHLWTSRQNYAALLWTDRLVASPKLVMPWKKNQDYLM